MSPEPNLGAQLVEVREAIETLKTDIATYRQGLNAQYERLSHETEVHKKLARYARRTWFEMMTYIFLVGALLSDVARAYATNQWWGLVFWTTEHGQGTEFEWALRLAGLSWQVGLLVFMGRRSQVPEWIFDRTPFAEERRLHRYGKRR